MNLNESASIGLARAMSDREAALRKAEALQEALDTMTTERDYFRDLVKAALDKRQITPEWEEASLTALEWSTT